MGRLRRAWAAAAIACASAGCHFESLEDCAHDADCALGDRCNAEGRFCELDTGPIRIGAILSLSGDFGPTGRLLLPTLTVAESEINARGGVAGRPVAFVPVDDQTDPEVARRVAKDLIENDRVAAILGPMISGPTLAAQEVTFAAHVLQISALAGSPLLSTAQPDDDRYFYRTIATMRTGSGAAVSMYARENAGTGPRCDTLSIVYSDDPTGQAYEAAVGELFKKLGGCLVESIAVPTAVQVDYDDAVSRLIAGHPDCAHLAAFPESGAEIVREFNAAAAADTAHDWSAFTWLGNTTVHNDAFLEEGRVDPLNPVPSEVEGFEGADIDSTPPTKQYKDFRVLYNQRLGLALEQDVPAFAANTYDAAILIALALEKAGSVTDRVRIRDGLRAVIGDGPEHHAYGPTELAEALAAIRRNDPIHYVGASGKLIFDATGTVSSPTVIWKVDKGAFTTVERFDEDDVQSLLAASPLPSTCP